MPDPQVFISYHRADVAIAERVRAHLLGNRCKTWMDQYDIPAGAYWPDEIDRGLGAADFVLGLLSPESVESRNVKNEWDWALQNGKRLVLLLVQPCSIPHRYISINFIDASQDFAAALDGLSRVLQFDTRPAAIQPPRTRYARSGDVSIAYQVYGDGPIDFVWAPGFISHIEHYWRSPSVAEFYARFGEFARVVLFDKRGTGLSDRVAGTSTLEERMDDVRAVMDAAGVRKAVIGGLSEGVALSVLFAATFPERTHALVLYGGTATYAQKPDYPWAPTLETLLEEIEEAKRTLHETWGTKESARTWLEHFGPSAVDDEEEVAWFADLLRLGASPGAIIALMQMNVEIDVRPALAAIRVPTLVVQRVGDRDAKLAEGRYLAEHISGAKMIELPGDDHIPNVGDVDALIEAIRTFVERLGPATEKPKRETFLSTIFSIAGEAAGSSSFAAMMAAELERFHGRALSDERGRTVISFDGPVRAIRFADAMVDVAEQAGIECRCGLHTGEVAIDGQEVSGPAVDGARDLAGVGRPGQMPATSIVRDLVAGSGIRFEPAEITLPSPLGDTLQVLLVDRSSLS